MKKLTLLIGIAIGYVLGAQAGRERYEQIRAKGQEVWKSPTVQSKVNEATETVKAKAPVVGDKVAGAAKNAASAAKDKASSSNNDEGTYTTGTDPLGAETPKV